MSLATEDLLFNPDNTHPHPEFKALASTGAFRKTHPFFDHFLGPEHGVLWALPFKRNKRRGVDLDHWLTVYYSDWSENVNKCLVASVNACYGLTIPQIPYGNMVLASGYLGRPGAEFGDINLSDWRHVLDFFSTYWNASVSQNPGADSIQAVKVCCPLEQRLYGEERLSEVVVDREMPGLRSQNSTSNLSVALGDGLKVVQLGVKELEHELDMIEEQPDQGLFNEYADALMVDIDPAQETWGHVIHPWNNQEGSVVFVRENGENLDLGSAQRMCQ